MKKWTTIEIEAAAARALKKTLDGIRASQPALLKKCGVRPDAVLVIDVSVVGSARMERLNFTYRGIRSDTDVLSFPSHAVFRSGGALGDLVFSRTKLVRQAREVGHSVATEIKILVVHGVLHLLDFDHERGPAAARKMDSYEKLLLAHLGVTTGLIARAQT